MNMSAIAPKLAAYVVVSVFIAAAASAAVALIAMHQQENGHTDGMLKSFSSTGEIREFVASTWEAVDAGYQDAISAPTEESFAVRDDSSIDYSTTNVQVEGIDEHDIVKTDGEFIYVAHSRFISILDVRNPESMSIMSVINASELLGEEDIIYSVNGLFVNDERLIAVMSIWNYYESVRILDLSTDDVIQSGTYTGPYTTVVVFDISNREEPEPIAVHGISGSLAASRMKGDAVYVLAQQHIYAYADGIALPWIQTGDERHEASPESVMYDPESDLTESYLNILALDVRDLETSHRSLMMSYISTVYMSHTGIYVTMPKWYGDLTLADDGLAPEEEDSARTTIYRIDVDKLTMWPAASGEVVGWLVNQFAMDEKDSFLRVATTTSWSLAENRVYVLDADLDVVGKLVDIAPDERIYSARFVDDFLYMVTFRQIDPLFVIDLSDPFDPRILGELVMPGFSTYLQPIADGYVLGIGREDESLKLSLYDVSDPTEPVETSKVLVSDLNSSWGSSWTSSIAESDHKAVLYDRTRNMLVIPLSAYFTELGSSQYETWDGFYVFTVTPGEGIVFEKALEQDGNPMRALYIEDTLYTVSMTIVAAHSIPELADLGMVVYSEEQIWYWWYW